jgi:hypothetical protein
VMKRSGMKAKHLERLESSATNRRVRGEPGRGNKG